MDIFDYSWHLVFASLSFLLIFFPISLLVYILCPNIGMKNFVLILFSIRNRTIVVIFRGLLWKNWPRFVALIWSHFVGTTHIQKRLMLPLIYSFLYIINLPLLRVPISVRRRGVGLFDYYNWLLRTVCIERIYFKFLKLLKNSKF